MSGFKHLQILYYLIYIFKIVKILIPYLYKKLFVDLLIISQNPTIIKALQHFGFKVKMNPVKTNSLFTEQRSGKPLLLAHRGLAQTFTMKDITNETCTAECIYEPEHPYLENTIPSMEEVLTRFPEQSFLLHIKSNDPKEGEQLTQFLSTLPEKRLRQLTVYGGDEPIAALKENLPDVRVLSKSTMKSFLLPYIAIGWTGYVPSACGNTQLHIPEKIAPWLWGRPNKFLNRMDTVDARVIVVGGDGSDFSSGFDAPEDIKRLPSDYTGGIWTNRIDKIAPLYQKGNRNTQ